MQASYKTVLIIIDKTTTRIAQELYFKKREPKQTNNSWIIYGPNIEG
jgi:hypothetical protein